MVWFEENHSGIVADMKPFFAIPLQDLESRIGLMRSALRTLPDAQLAAEMDQIAASGRDECAKAALLALYRAEEARRASPEQKHDAALDAALSRLERQTTAEDRQLVRTIGEQLHRIGRAAAIHRAAARMTADCGERRARLRTSILERRWAGLA